MLKTLLSGLLPLLISGYGFSQSMVRSAVDSYRTTQDAASLDLLTANGKPKEVAAAIYASAIDTTISDHKGTVQLIRLLERKTTDPASRESYVVSLTEILWRSSASVGASSLKLMEQFERKSFSQSVKDDLMTYISEKSENRSEAILLLGFIGNQNDISFLKNLEHYASISKKDKYKVKLALVRLNDAVTTEEYLAELGSRRINDELVTNVLSDLIYTHNQEVYKVLLAELNNQTPACLSANNDSDEHILCAYRILEQLSPEIREFPVAVDKSGELAGDYEKALITAREWYVINAASFTINADHF